jgi:flavin-dependent amine oxidoreductase
MGNSQHPNSYASNVPTRELHYWMRKDGTKGMIMIYTDRPGTQFWSDYLPRFEEQDEAEKWTKQKGNARLRLKFEQYLLENEVKDFKRGNLLAYGIRDWSKDPYGAACHAWRPGRKSWEVIERLKAFSIGKRGLPNVHICGEAYSDYQGFIEGALRSAAIVLNVLGAKIPGV